MRQVYVPDVFRKFADVLDDPDTLPKMDDFDPQRVKLTMFLNAVGTFARDLGIDLIRKRLSNGVDVTPINRKLTDELRRFADVIEKKHDDVRQVDPRYRRLTAALRAAQIYAEDIGRDLGVGGCGVMGRKKVPELK